MSKDPVTLVDFAPPAHSPDVVALANAILARLTAEGASMQATVNQDPKIVGALALLLKNGFIAVDRDHSATITKSGRDKRMWNGVDRKRAGAPNSN